MYIGLPSLENVLMVKGLTTNLVSISQLRDQGFKVIFNKSEYVVSIQGKKVVMKGSRSKDNYYLLISHNREYPSTCMISKINETKLWHQKLGHLNLKSMKKIVSEESIKGLPNLDIEAGKVYGECQIGKHTKMPHKKL